MTLVGITIPLVLYVVTYAIDTSKPHDDDICNIRMDYVMLSIWGIVMALALSLICSFVVLMTYVLRKNYQMIVGVVFFGSAPIILPVFILMICFQVQCGKHRPTGIFIFYWILTAAIFTPALLFSIGVIMYFRYQNIGNYRKFTKKHAEKAKALTAVLINILRVKSRCSHLPQKYIEICDSGQTQYSSLNNGIDDCVLALIAICYTKTYTRASGHRYIIDAVDHQPALASDASGHDIDKQMPYDDGQCIICNESLMMTDIVIQSDCCSLCYHRKCYFSKVTWTHEISCFACNSNISYTIMQTMKIFASGSKNKELC